MKSTRSLTISFILIIVIAILHFAGQYLYLYWRYPGYDKLVHFLGGVWVVFIVLSIISQKFKALKNSQILLLGICITLLVGIFWEIFELAGKITVLSDLGYIRDTIGDIIADVLGGIAGSFFILHRHPQSSLPENQSIK